MFLEKLEKLCQEYVFNTDQKEEYTYRFEQVKDYYLSLSETEQQMVSHQIISILILNIDSGFIVKSLINFLYFIGEEDMDIKTLSQEESYVIATSLTLFAKIADEEKRSLWISSELIKDLISITTDLDDAVNLVLEFQNRTIRKRLPNEPRETLDDFMLLSDQEIELEAKRFVEEKRGLRRLRDKSGKNN